MKIFGHFSWSQDRLSAMQLGNCDLDKIINQVIPLNIVQVHHPRCVLCTIK